MVAVPNNFAANLFTANQGETFTFFISGRVGDDGGRPLPLRQGFVPAFPRAAPRLRRREARPRRRRALRRRRAQRDGLLDAPLTPPAFTGYMASNERFHALIGRMSGSPMVMRQLDRSCHHPFAAPGTFLLAQAHLPEARGELRRAQDQHHAILDAIQRREGARVEALVREHARLFGRNLLRVVKLQQALKLVPGSVKGLL